MPDQTLRKADCNRSFWATIQFIGLQASGVPSIIRPMFFGGKYSGQIDGEPLTDQKILIINHGGIRNKEVPASVKVLFKKDILPALVEVVPGLGEKFNGKINLHFNGGVLTTINLTH